MSETKAPKTLIISLIGFLLAWSIKIIVEDIVQNSKSLSSIITSSIPREAEILLWIALILIILTFFIPSFIDFIIDRILIYRYEKGCLPRFYKKKIKSELKNLTEYEKDILNTYYMKTKKLAYKISNFSQEYNIFGNLLDKRVLYLYPDHPDVQDVDNPKVDYHVFCMEEFTKKYLKRHKKLLK